MHGMIIMTVLSPSYHPSQAAAHAEECLDQEDWIDGVEVLLTQLELPDKPPADITLNQAQPMLRIATDIEALERILRKRLDQHHRVS